MVSNRTPVGTSTGAESAGRPHPAARRKVEAKEHVGASRHLRLFGRMVARAARARIGHRRQTGNRELSFTRLGRQSVLIHIVENQLTEYTRQNPAQSAATTRHGFPFGLQATAGRAGRGGPQAGRTRHCRISIEAAARLGKPVDLSDDLAFGDSLSPRRQKESEAAEERRYGESHHRYDGRRDQSDDADR
jgi:hypothetical protein